jgi:Leucine-rich repeat (LRR) protein
MKRAFKIIIPILLVIAVIGSIGWYLFRFDPGFTRDFLLRQARSAENRGNHSFAAWIYELTYRHSQGDENIAIELAEQFKSVDNYTKAEYTLSNAIADGGSAQLYIALCKTYVEQDKLLDAVTMLDNIADPKIKAQLDEMRPDAPVANPESGYYNQYISVSFHKADGAIYYSTDNEYPSTKKTPISGKLELPGGESHIYALCINNEGLVSPLSIFNYTIAGVIEEVSIQDAALDQIVRQILGVGTEHKLYSNELWSITELEITNEVKSLEDLSKLPFLEKLTIPAGDYANIGTVSSLTGLHTLHISGVTLNSEDVTAIGNLPKLQTLTLSQCNLSSVAGLASAVSLQTLDLSNNTLRDLSPLKELTNLQTLILPRNAITNLENIAGLQKLEKLDLSNNAVTSSAPLAGCTALKNLQLSNNQLKNLEGLDKLNGLTVLVAESNQLTDINPLATCTELIQLDISDNKVTDLTPVSSMVKLQKLDFSNNRVEQLPKIPSKNVLTEINGAYNSLTSLKELENQSNLNYVIMDYNNGLKSIVPLRNCYSLVEVSVYGTGVTDISALTSMNIIVRYSPIAMD